MVETVLQNPVSSVLASKPLMSNLLCVHTGQLPSRTVCASAQLSGGGQGRTAGGCSANVRCTRKRNTGVRGQAAAAAAVPADWGWPERIRTARYIWVDVMIFGSLGGLCLSAICTLDCVYPGACLQIFNVHVRSAWATHRANRLPALREAFDA